MEDYCAKSHNTVPECNSAVEDLVIKIAPNYRIQKMLSKMGMADN
jgi:hypothetical protein